MNDDASNSLSEFGLQAEDTMRMMKAMETAATSAFSSITTSIGRAISKGGSFEDILGNIVQSIGKMSLNAAQSGIQSSITSLLGAAASGLVNSVFEGGSLGSASAAFGGGVASVFGENTGADLVSNGLSRQAASPLNVTIQAQDVQSFKGSEQHIAASLARAVARGQRNL